MKIKHGKRLQNCQFYLPANGILKIPTSKSCCNKLELNESYKRAYQKALCTGVL